MVFDKRIECFLAACILYVMMIQCLSRGKPDPGPKYTLLRRLELWTDCNFGGCKNKKNEKNKVGGKGLPSAYVYGINS